jgi:pyruvate,orthophosphate dikinase
MKIENLLKKYVFWPEINNEFNKNIDFSNTNISEVAKEISIASNIKTNVSLKNYIFKFYGYNEYLTNIRNKSNGFIDKKDTAIFSEYQNFLNDFSKKIFSYILYCCISEARHSNFLHLDDDYNEKMTNSYIDLIKNDKQSREYKKYMTEFSDQERVKLKFTDYLNDLYEWVSDVPNSFIKEYKKNNPLNNDNILKKFKKSTINKDKFNNFINFLLEIKEESENKNLEGDGGNLQRYLAKKKFFDSEKIKSMTTADLLECINLFFREGFDTGYGGDLWGDIAKHALDFAKGEINAEMFLDKSLSLEHNGGNMFNKDFIFSEEYTTAEFYWPTVVNDENVEHKHVNMTLVDFLLNLQNSSSVLILTEVEKFKNFLQDPENIKEAKQIIRKILPDAKINEYQLTKIINDFSSVTDAMENAGLKLIEENSKFVDMIKESNSYSKSFNFAGFLLAYYKSKHDNGSKYEKNVLNSTLLLNVFDSLIQKSDNKEVILIPQIKEKSFNLYDLNNLSSKDLTKEIIGGKAKGLFDLTKSGFNVPKALVFDTKTCLSYLNDKKYFDTEYKKINSKLKDYLKDNSKNIKRLNSLEPILVSIRSGAPISMPGMMDSILNVGIDDTTYPFLIKKYGKQMIDECALSFVKQFCSSKLNLNISFPKNLDKALDKFATILIKNDLPCNRRDKFPLNIENQIKLSVEAVFDSWNSERAYAWRNEKKISHEMGTTATIQKMVFGNKNSDSFTCVVFSRDCITGKPEIMGEFLRQAQGEDLVAGKKTPTNILELKKTNLKLFQKIEYIAKTLEEENKSIQDIEITVEDNEVFVLQKRSAVVSSEAQIALAKEMGFKLSDYVKISNLIGTLKVDTIKEPDFSGLSANPGVISGIIVKTESDVDKYKNAGLPLIFLSEQALPEHAPIMISTDAFITEMGGATSHAAILARSMNKPCVVGLGSISSKVGSIVTIDANNGSVWAGNLPIIKTQKESNELAEEILKEKKIVLLKDDYQFHQLSLNVWTNKLSLTKDVSKTPKFHNFLSIAQKTAAIILKEDEKKKLKI